MTEAFVSSMIPKKKHISGWKYENKERWYPAKELRRRGIAMPSAAAGVSGGGYSDGACGLWHDENGMWEESLNFTYKGV